MPGQEQRFVIPRFEAGATPEYAFSFGIKAGIREALSRIDENFDHPVDRSHQLFYHNRTHSLGVMWRVGKVMRAMQKVDNSISDRDIALAEFAAAWHDTIQHSDILSTHDKAGRLIKVRQRAGNGANEKESAALAMDYLTQFNVQNGSVFTQADKVKIFEAITLTAVIPDASGDTLVQPEFETFINRPIAQALALADLDGAQMEGARIERWTTHTLFLEENPDIAEYFSGEHEGERRVSRDVVRETQYIDRYHAFLTKQQKFLKARDNRLYGFELPHTFQSEAVSLLFHTNADAQEGLQVLIQESTNIDFPALVSALEDTIANSPTYDFSQSSMLADEIF